LLIQLLWEIWQRLQQRLTHLDRTQVTWKSALRTCLEWFEEMEKTGNKRNKGHYETWKLGMKEDEEEKAFEELQNALN
jgi:hypothetical protein